MSVTFGFAAAHDGTPPAGDHAAPAEALAERLVRTFSPRAVFLARPDAALARALHNWGVRVDPPGTPVEPSDLSLWLDAEAELDDEAAAPLVAELARRGATTVLRLRFSAPAAARPPVRWLTRLAEAGLQLDPLADAAFLGPAALVFRPGAEPLSLAARQGLAEALALRVINAELAAALAQAELRARRAGERVGVLEAQARDARFAQVTLEREARTLGQALRAANDVLADELEAVRSAEGTVARDIVALRKSLSWRAKLGLVRVLRR